MSTNVVLAIDSYACAKLRTSPSLEGSSTSGPVVRHPESKAYSSCLLSTSSRVVPSVPVTSVGRRFCREVVGVVALERGGS